MTTILRLLIIAVLFFLIYQVLKGWGGKKGKTRQSPSKAGRNEGPEELVKDELTGIYFPRPQGVAALIEGRVYYFLNTKNRDEYLDVNRSPSNGGRK